MPSYKTTIHWFRRDLRLTDNTALLHASADAETVVPVYLLSDWKADHNWTGPARQQFLCGCLDSLSNDLKSIDSRLILRDGGQVEAMRQLIKDTKAEAIYFNRDPDPFGKAMEAKMRELAREIGIEIHDFKDVVLHEHDEIANLSDKPYKVYTPYSKNWFTHDKADDRGRVRVLGKTPANLKSKPVPTLSRWGLDSSGANLIPAGEKAAHNRLKTAFDGILQRYADDRNTPIGQTTSMLGADLRFGTISPRQVFHRAEKAIAETKSGSERESLYTFQKQLAWREFFMAILGHFPEVLETDFAEKWRGLKWDQPEDFPDKWKAWKTGKNRISHRRCRNASARRHRFHAQPSANDRGYVSHQRPPFSLDSRRVIFYAMAPRWRDRQQQRRLAMVRGDRRRRRSLFSDSEPLDPNRAL